MFLKMSPQMSTKLVGTFSLPPPGGRTYCPTDVFSYTSQAPAQPPPTASAAHPLLCFMVNTCNSMLLLLGADPLCRWAQSHLFLEDFTPGQLCAALKWQQQGSRRFGTATAPATCGDTPGPTLCRYLISHHTAGTALLSY